MVFVCVASDQPHPSAPRTTLLLMVRIGPHIAEKPQVATEFIVDRGTRGIAMHVCISIASSVRSERYIYFRTKRLFGFPDCATCVIFSSFHTP